MTSAQEQINRARDLVRTAAEQWDAARLSTISDSVAILGSSAETLEAVSRMFNGSMEANGNEMRAALLALKADAARLQRLVDASAAFLRGLPGSQTTDAELYQAGGSMIPVSAGLDSWRLQG